MVGFESSIRFAQLGAVFTALAAALVIGTPVDAQAAFDPIPDDDEFVPFLCGGEPAWDPYRDASGGTDHRDPVGDADRPAALRTATDSHLYLRMRLDGDPARDADSLKSFGWGYLFDVPPSNFDDGDPSTNTYDYLLHLEGGGGTDGLLRFRSNEGQTDTDDPTVPAAGDLLWEYEHNDPEPIWHVKPAPEEPVGAEPEDWWLTVAVAWDDLEPYGVTPDGMTVLWMGSSNSNQAINVDFICHDGDVDPAPDMSTTASDGEPLDPSLIDDGDDGDNGDDDNGDDDDDNGDGDNGDGDNGDGDDDDDGNGDDGDDTDDLPDMPDDGDEAGAYHVTGGGPVCSTTTGSAVPTALMVAMMILVAMAAVRRHSSPKSSLSQQ